MHFEMSQVLNGSPAQVARTLASAELCESLVATPKLSAPVLLDRVVDGHNVTLTLRYSFVGDLATPVTAVLERSKLVWDEVSIHRLAERQVDFELKPIYYGDRLRSHGTVSYRAEGQQTVRTISGELKVKALLVANTVERAISSGLSEHLNDEAVAINAYLATVN